MSGQDLIRHTVKNKFPDAEVIVQMDDTLGGYVLSVRHAKFHAMPRADREAEIYSAFGRLPLPLIAKIKAIDTSTKA